jgi:nitric oxide reductase activation protein
VAAAAAAGRADPMGGAGVWPEAPELPAGGDGGDGRDAGDAGDGPAGPGACAVPAGGAVTAIRRRLSAAAASPACPRWWCGDRGRETDFTPLEKEVAVGRRPAEHRAVAGEVRQWIGPLRREFERLGRRDVDEPAARRGRRLDVARARSVALGPRIDLFVGRRELVAADCELGLLVDRSGSMDGPKLALARRFGVLVAEAVRGIRGISGWTAAFDHDTWYELGPFERTAIASLAAGGGNNDAAAVHRAGERLRGSRRRHRALVLVSDGEPTACTVAAFHAEAARLERERGIAVIHVVIDQLEREAVLPRSVDLSGKDFDEAVRRFGRLVADLVRHGGRAVVARPAGTAS